MKWREKLRLMATWSLLTAVIIGIFWGVWYLAAGYVPVSPLFAISRWWDILLGPIFSVVFVLLLTNEWVEEYVWLEPSAKINFLTVVLLCGPFLGLIFGLEVGLMAGAVFFLFSFLLVGAESSFLDAYEREKMKNSLLAEEGEE